MDIVKVYHTLTLSRLWGVGRSAAADGTLLPLADSNPLAELHFRYRMYGGIAYHHVADYYIAIFSHFMPCGVWETIFMIDALLQNRSDLQPRRVHADTQGQSTPMFALANLLGIELLRRIRNWKDLSFYIVNGVPLSIARKSSLGQLIQRAVGLWAQVVALVWVPPAPLNEKAERGQR